MDLRDVLKEGLSATVKVDDRPRIFTQAAYELRKLRLEEAIEAGDKAKKRFMAVASWDKLHEHFKGRDVNPVDAEEFETYLVAELSELPAEYGDFQFTKRANKRVSYSYYEDELRTKVFHGKTSVDLLDVELAILDLEKRDSRIKGVDFDDAAGRDLAACEVGIRNICIGEFLPKTREGKNDKYTLGNYSPDLADVEQDDGPLAVCTSCFKELGARRAKENEERKVRGEEQLPFPRSMCLADATDAFERKAYAIGKQKEIKEGRERRRTETQEDTSKFLSRVTGVPRKGDEVQWAKRRYGR